MIIFLGSIIPGQDDWASLECPPNLIALKVDFLANSGNLEDIFSIGVIRRMTLYEGAELTERSIRV